MKQQLFILILALATMVLVGAGVDMLVEINWTVFISLLLICTRVIILMQISLDTTKVVSSQFFFGLTKKLGEVFTIRNFINMLAFAIIGWYVKTKLVYYFGLDVNTLFGFISVILPAGLITSVARVVTELFMQDLTLTHNDSPKAGNLDIKYKHVHYSSQGGGSSGASGSNAGQSSQNNGSQIARQLAEQRNRSIAESANRNVAQQQGRNFANNHLSNLPRLYQEADEAQTMPQVLENQRRYELELERNRQNAIAERARVNAAMLQNFANSGSDVGFLVPDAQGIGARGYIHGGINQPYARELAEALKNQGVAGKTCSPQLDANAKNFLAGALPHIRPEVYGPNPTSSGNSSMIITRTITKLEKMP